MADTITSQNIYVSFRITLYCMGVIFVIFHSHKENVKQCIFVKHLKGKGQGKILLVNSMKAYRGSRHVPSILNLGARWRLVVNITPWPLYPGKEPWYPLNRWLDGPHSHSVLFGEDKNLLPLVVFEPWTIQPVV